MAVPNTVPVWLSLKLDICQLAQAESQWTLGSKGGGWTKVCGDSTQFRLLVPWFIITINVCMCSTSCRVHNCDIVAYNCLQRDDADTILYYYLMIHCEEITRLSVSVWCSKTCSPDYTLHSLSTVWQACWHCVQAPTCAMCNPFGALMMITIFNAQWFSCNKS